MAKRNHYSRRQRVAAIRFWIQVASPAKWSLERASAESEEHLGFHVPASTLGMWKRAFRKRRKAVQPQNKVHRVPMSANQPEIPLIPEKIKDARTEKQLLSTLIAEQRETNATLNVIARHLHNIAEHTKPVLLVAEAKHEKKGWRPW